METSERARRLKQARLARGFKTAADAARAFDWNRNTYASNENGNAPYSFRKARAYAAAFGVRAEWLYDGTGPSEPVAEGARARDRKAGAPPVLVPLIGRVGADASGRVLFAVGQDAGDLVPLPPGGTRDAVALLVVGGSMPGFADEGSLIYFEDQRTPPTADMLGQVVVVETEDDEVLVKRLRRGERSNRYNLESLEGPTLQDRKLRWAAHVTAIVPPFQARRILRPRAAAGQ